MQALISIFSFRDVIPKGSYSEKHLAFLFSLAEMRDSKMKVSSQQGQEGEKEKDNPTSGIMEMEAFTITGETASLGTIRCFFQLY